MSEIKYIQMSKINPSSLTKLTLPKKEVKVQDPIRYPAVVEPIEKEFQDGYDKMMKTMNKMLAVELMRKIKES